MSDPRSTGKSSKTAAVVMLVVFVQVLIVAVLGLGAIGRDRVEARRLAEDEAQSNAETALAALLNRARDQIDFALKDVRNNPRFQDLESLREGGGHGRHIDLVNTVYQVDPDTRELFWMDGETRLYVPPERRAQIIEQNRTKESDDVAERLHKSYREERGENRLSSGLEFCRRFPYRFAPEDAGYTQALGAVLSLIDEAQQLTEFGDVDDADTAWVTLERTLLTAIEVTALNKDRIDDIPRIFRTKFVEIPQAVDAAITGLPPDRVDIRRHVEACQDARRHLEGPEPILRVLEVALVQVGRTEDVTWVGQRLVGLIPNVRVLTVPGTRHILVLMNVEAVKHLVEEVAGHGDLQKVLDRHGLLLKVAPLDEVPEGRIAVQQSLREIAGIRIPYRAELHWARPPLVPVEGPGELFYWGIILLSAAGLGVGGWVMMRLYTREVRLARLKADFVSNLSHELKTPLTSIGMWTELLQDGALEDDEARSEGLGILAQEADRLQGIVHRMLDTAKREARGVPYELTPGDFSEVVGRAAERFRRIMVEPGLDLVVEVAPEPLFVRMDAAAIDDVVSNLVSNAWKYKDGNQVRVVVRTVRRGRKAELTVADDGLGIPSRERRKVFEMFYRADAYLTRAAGTGLGLSLVRTIVRAHKGWVRIENGLDGKGSTFRIRVPLTRARPAESLGGPTVRTAEAQTTP